LPPRRPPPLSRPGRRALSRWGGLPADRLIEGLGEPPFARGSLSARPLQLGQPLSLRRGLDGLVLGRHEDDRLLPAGRGLTLLFSRAAEKGVDLVLDLRRRALRLARGRSGAGRPLDRLGLLLLPFA
jgi:hypothetical protein